MMGERGTSSNGVVGRRCCAVLKSGEIVGGLVSCGGENTEESKGGVESEL